MSSSALGVEVVSPLESVQCGVDDASEQIGMVVEESAEPDVE